MIEIITKSDCCGCGGCSQVCPKQCIEMKADNEGFLYPSVDKNACVNCGLCNKVCQIINDDRHITECQDAFVAYAIDESVRLSSSSGGVFSILAEDVIQNGGIVFGAAFDQNWLVRHVGVENLTDLVKLRGSKYLQSRTEDTFHEVKAALDQGRQVLYSGTGCQIAGLKSFLKRDYPNLLSVDIVCHGVPSPKLWKRYLTERERAFGADAQEVAFRSKVTGWKNYSMIIDFSNGSKYENNHKSDPYMQMFLKNVCLRPSCHDCHFKTTNSHADITLGDCWCIKDVMPDMDDDKGVSVVFIHTEKGKNIFKQIDSRLTEHKTNFSQVCQPMMNKSATMHPHRNRFFYELEKERPVEQLYNLLSLSLVERVNRKIKKYLH